MRMLIRALIRTLINTVCGFINAGPPSYLPADGLCAGQPSYLSADGRCVCFIIWISDRYGFLALAGGF